MKAIMIFCLNFTFIFHSFAEAPGQVQSAENELYHEFLKTHATASMIDPVETLNSSPEEIKKFIHTVFNSPKDKALIEKKFAGFNADMLKASYGKDKKSIVVKFNGKKMVISNINPKNKTFTIGEEKISLVKVYSFSQLVKVFEGLKNPLVTTYNLNPVNLVISDAHALAGIALGLIAFAIASVAILGITHAQQALSLEGFESDLEAIEGICEAPKDQFGDYIYRYDSAIRRFENTSRELYGMSSPQSRNRARSLSSCNEIRESWSAWAASWAYSLVNWTMEDRRDKIIDLCRRSIRVEGCIAEYRANSSNVDGSSRNIRGQRRQRRQSNRTTGNRARGN